MNNESTQSSGDLSGQTIGQYEIGHRIGKGGMATVYIAQQRSIGRTVAVKVLPAAFMHDEMFMQRFDREVKVIAALQHPRVLPVYDYGDFEGRPYIVIAYIDGGTLADRIKEGPLSLEQTAHYVEQIAEGLDFAHRRGIIHRDFKPSNVLIDNQDNIYLADFGIAKISESTIQLTGTGVVGTPAYMAPEMGQHGTVTPAVDIYALGVTIYQMLTGDYPFHGETPLSVMMAHISEPVPDLHIARPDVPEDVSDVVTQAMAKNPEERYATAGELAREFRKALRMVSGGAGRPAAAASVPATTAAPARTPPVVNAPVPTDVPAPTRAPTMADAPATPAPVSDSMTVEKKGGCRWGLVLGVGGGGLVLALLCLGGFILLGGAKMLNPPTDTPVPTNTPAPTNTPLPTDTPLPTSTPRPTATPEPSATTKPPATADSGLVSLVIVNQSNTVICYVYLSPSSADTWGSDQLGQSQVIGTGESYTLDGVPPDEYDFEALDCSQNVLDFHYHVQFSDSPYTWTIQDANAALTVINNSSLPVCTLYVASPQDASWGPNRLGDNQQIAVGGSFTVNVAPGSWDVHAESCDTNSYWEEMQVTINQSFTWTLTD